MCMPLPLEAEFLAPSWKIAFWLIAESQYVMSCPFTSDLPVAW